MRSEARDACISFFMGTSKNENNTISTKDINKFFNTALAAYNSSCVEMRSKARDAYIRAIITDTI
jgi:hypothetical protein